jgi:hypothetical protein
MSNQDLIDQIKFNPKKRMQLLKGSKVLCKLDIPSAFANKIAFKAANIYTVIEGNIILGDDGCGHTWNIDCFIEAFNELSNSSLPPLKF